MYAADLTEYAYAGQSFDNVAHIGWLDRKHAFERGDVPKEFTKHLAQLANGWTARQMRGFHRCNLCPIWKRGFKRPGAHRVVVDGVECWVGSAEIWVPRDQTRYWASPDMIVHYVRAHRYKPPDEYVASVLKHRPPEGWFPQMLTDLGFES